MRPLPITLVSILLVLVACGGSDDAPQDVDAGPEVTYYQDIKPIVDAKCVQCHTDGGIAPFSLVSFDDASTHAGVSLLAIESGLMPPWPPDDACAEYVGNRSLSEEQKALFARWVEAGTPMGDPAQEGPALETDDRRLSRVDLELTANVAFVPTKEPDDYRCFLIPWPEETSTHVTGFRAVPGNDAIVHHVIAFHAEPDDVATYEALDAAEEGPGWTCFGGTGGPSRSWMGAWAPGDQGYDYPTGTGLAIEPGSAVILQVHYNVLSADPAPDQTAVQFRLDDTVERLARLQLWANPQWVGSQMMHIPPNEPDTMHAFEFDPTQIAGPLRVYSAGLHMHTLGTSARLSVERAGGGETCLLDIPDWDFDWQGSYGLAKPVDIDAGDILRIECHWDNTVENQPMENGSPRVPHDVYWGEGTGDEMCLGVLFVTDQ